MTIRLVSLAAATALAFVPAGKAADGNTAVGSVGTVQVSSVSSEPVVAVQTPAAQATVEAPLSLPGSGGNQATNSIGTVQAGGGHSAADSVGTVQAASAQVGPVARNSGTPAAIVRTVTPTVTIATPAANTSVGPPAVHVNAGPAQQAAPVAGDTVVGGELMLALESLWLQAKNLGVSPGFSLTLDPLAEAFVGGTIGTGGNAGDQTSSLLTGQTGAVDISPSAGVASPELGSSVELGGSSGVSGNGANLADTSVGTVQSGGPNTAGGSAGTVQVGGVGLAPTLNATTPAGNAALGGASGIAGGTNRATDSIGTVQIGGGNTSDGSTGSLQAGAVTLGPSLAVTDTPVGDALLGGSTGVAGNGNTAGNSIGTVQVGGGNQADTSGSTTQVGPVASDASLTVVDTPAGGGSIGSPTQVGSNGGNTATGSTGTTQVGGGNGTTNSIGATQVGGGRTLESVAGGTPPASRSTDASFTGTPNASPVATSQLAGRREAGKRIAEGAPAPSKAKRTAAGEPLVSRVTRVTGSLPFTGLNLGFLLALGLGLILAGLGLGNRARR
jgi:hypothetical protein